MQQLGQSAIEYLMTYGWMLLVVAITGGTIFSMAEGQDIENVSGFTSNNVVVEDFGVSSSEGLMFSMISPVRTIKVEKIRLREDNRTNITYSINDDLSGQSIMSLPGVIPSGESGELDMEIIYDSGDLEGLTTSGSVQGTAELDKDFDNRTLILDGLKGYWPLTSTYADNIQAYDVSGNQNHGDLNGLEFIQSEDIGNAINFTESNYVQIDHDNAFENFEEVTIFAVVKMTGRTGEWQGVLTKSNHPNSIIVEDDDRGFVGSVKIDGDRQYTGTNIPINEFVGETVSVAHTYDSNTGEALFYIDGAIESDQDHDIGEITWDGANINIGNRGGGGRPWNGSIKDVMIFDRALSQSEIRTLHNNSAVNS